MQTTLKKAEHSTLYVAVVAFYESLGYAIEDRLNLGKRLP